MFLIIKIFLEITYKKIRLYAPPWGLSTLAKEFTAAARTMQSSSNESSTLVSGKV